MEAYRRDLSQFFDFCHRRGHRSLEEVDRLAVRRFVAHLATRNYARASVARKVSAVRAFFTDAARRGAVPLNPAVGVASPKLPRRLPRVPSASALGGILDGLDGDDPVSRRDRALLEVLYGSGLRVAEAAALTVGDVQATRGGVRDLIRVSGKGGKDRAVPLSGPARAALEQYLEEGRGALARGGASGSVDRGARRAPGGAGHPPGGAGPARHLPPCPAPLLCHPFAGEGRRSARRPGAPRAPSAGDYPGLHSRDPPAPQVDI